MSEFLPNPQPDTLHTPVATQLHQQIANSPNGRITWADFMETSLYGPGGYYASGRASIGSGDTDFNTAPEQHAVFNRVVANSLAVLWERQGRPQHTFLIEGGAGNGTMGHDILEKLQTDHPRFYEASRYVIIERSYGLIGRQRERLTNYADTSWVNGSATDLPMNGVSGTFVTNEVPDAFPFHRVVRREGGIREIYVTTNETGIFTEIEGALSERVEDPQYWQDLALNQEKAISPLWAQWMRGVGRALEYGHIVTIDYAQDDSPQSKLPRVYARGEHRPPVSLALERPGQVDITASVDFKLLRAVGLEHGLQPVYDASQWHFLRDFGFARELRKLGITLRAVDKSQEHLDPDDRFIQATEVGRQWAAAQGLFVRPSGGPAFKAFRALIQEKLPGRVAHPVTRSEVRLSQSSG